MWGGGDECLRHHAVTLDSIYWAIVRGCYLGLEPGHQTLVMNGLVTNRLLFVTWFASPQLQNYNQEATAPGWAIQMNAAETIDEGMRTLQSQHPQVYYMHAQRVMHRLEMRIGLSERSPYHPPASAARAASPTSPSIQSRRISSNRRPS